MRRLASIAVVLPLAAGGLVLAAAPAFASGSISDPVNGATFTSDTTVGIRASYSSTDRTELRLKTPTGTEQVVASFAGGTLTAQSGTLSYALDTSCATYPSPSCSGRAPALNGTWTVRLAGGAVDTSTFILRIPPRTPTGFAARPDGYRAVVLSWTKGAEPDLVGWTLYEGSTVAVPSIGLDACSGTSCSATLTYPSDGTGAHTYGLIAHRSVAPGSSDTLSSDRASSSATLDAPPPPSPSSSPTSAQSASSGPGATAGPSGSSGASGSTTTSGSTSSTPATGSAGSGISTGGKPASALDQRQAFALVFNAPGPRLALPALPSQQAAGPVVAPLPDGTYKKTLGYTAVTKQEKVSVPQAAATRLTGAVGSAFDGGHFVRSLAGALVLLLSAAHLRRWLGSHAER